MKRLAFFSAAALIALPLVAGDAKPASPQTATAPQSATAQPAPAQQPAASSSAAKPAAQTAAAADSPLVAAAKRSTAARKKSSIVITNETLGGKNAKVTTTQNQGPLNLGAPAAEAPASPNELVGTLVEIQKRKDAVAEQKRAQQSEAAKAKRMQELRARMEDDSLALDVDPAQVEHQLEQTSTQGQQQTPPPRKKP